MLMNDCSHIEESLSAYLDGELTQQDRQRVELHADQCDRCTQALAELTRIREGISQLRQPEPNEIQWSRMMRLTATKTSRGVGWIAGIAGGVVLAGYAVYEFATDETTDAFFKVATAALAGGVLLLLFSVLMERLHARKSDRYKDVEL